MPEIISIVAVSIIIGGLVALYRSRKSEDNEIDESGDCLEVSFPLRDQIAELRNPDTNDGIWKWKD